MAIIFLDEQMVGASPNGIGYPSLITCVGVTAGLSNGWLVGAHSTSATEAPDLCGKIWDCIHLVNANVPNAGAIEWLCLAGCLIKHPGGDPTAVYPRDFSQSPNGDGVPGDLEVKVYDIFSKYKAATFALVTRQGTGQMPRVDYKRETKMDYSTEVRGRGALGNFDASGFLFSAKLPVVKVGGFRKGTTAGPKGGVSVPVFHSAKVRR